MKSDPLENLEELPLASFDLIDLLDKSLPPRCINPGETLESAHRYAGAREIVDTLLVMRQDMLDRQADESNGPEDGPEYSVLRGRKGRAH